MKLKKVISRLWKATLILFILMLSVFVFSEKVHKIQMVENVKNVLMGQYYDNCPYCGEYIGYETDMCPFCSSILGDGPMDCPHYEFIYEYYDEYNHIQRCRDCSMEIGTVPHMWDNGVCTECNYQCTHNGTPIGEWCSICNSEVTCTHSYSYTDNGDGTHSGICTNCNETLDSMPHNWRNGICIECRASCSHDWSNNDGVCSICNMQCKHINWVGGICSECNMTCSHTNKKYIDNNDGTHIEQCQTCKETFGNNEEHIYNSNGLCTKCNSGCKHGEYTYTNNEDGTHKVVCGICLKTVNENEKHIFNGSSNCTKCNGECKHSDIEWVRNTEDDYNEDPAMEDQGAHDGHDGYCKECKELIWYNEEHEFENGTCTKCGSGCSHTLRYATFSTINPPSNYQYKEVHNVDCKCGYKGTEAHNIKEEEPIISGCTITANFHCTKCAYSGSNTSESHGATELQYNDNLDGKTHTKEEICTQCHAIVGTTASENHEWDYTNSTEAICRYCNATCYHSITFSACFNPKDGHYFQCDNCGYYILESHNMETVSTSGGPCIVTTVEACRDCSYSEEKTTENHGRRKNFI